MFDNSILNYVQATSTSLLACSPQGPAVVLPLTNVQGTHLDSLRVVPFEGILYNYSRVMLILALAAQKMNDVILYLTSIFYMMVETFVKIVLLNPDFLLLWISSPVKSRNIIQLLELFMCRNLYL